MKSYSWYNLLELVKAAVFIKKFRRGWEKQKMAEEVSHTNTAAEITTIPPFKDTGIAGVVAEEE